MIEAYQTDKEIDIETLEGTMHASVGDWIITGVNDEKYPCKPDIFKKTYEAVDDTRIIFDNCVKREEIVAEPVVHCKDCKHGHPKEDHEPDIYCEWWDYPMPVSGFCSKASKKGE